MVQSINLIPKEERIEQAKSKVVKLSTILSILLLVIVGGLGGYFYYQVNGIKTNLASSEKDVEGYRTKIASYRDVEINARNLYKKSTALQTIFNNRNYFSKLVEAIESSTPQGIVIESFSMGADTSISLSGRSDSYNTVQEFTNKILQQDLFTEVSLKSVGLEGRQNLVNFFIVVTYNGDLLHE